MRKVWGKIALVGLITLACVQFQYNGYSWSVYMLGLPNGAVVLGIIALVVLYRIYRVMRALRPGFDFKYAWLIPIAVLAVFVHFRFYGESITTDTGKAVQQWEFNWSDPQWSLPFLLALILVILLVNILRFLRYFAANAGKQSQEA